MSRLSGAGVLITGATGSFGNAFVRHLLAMEDGPARICVYSRCEYKQAVMRQEFADIDPEPHRLRWFIGDVRDAERLSVACHKVDVLVHAAALKRVDACEYNPTEAIATNVGGAISVVNAAMEAGVKYVVALSSDKACAPNTLYGASKLCAEKIITAAYRYSGERCLFSCTRYGNIAGSRGSVIPTWREAIAKGQTITVTDPGATRFWMTQDQAVGLVFYAIEHTQGGEVFVPSLPAFKIGDLGLAIGATWPRSIIRTTLGPTEKKHESLISVDEARCTTYTGWHYVLRPSTSTTPIPGAITSDACASMTVEDLRRGLEVIA